MTVCLSDIIFVKATAPDEENGPYVSKKYYICKVR